MAFESYGTLRAWTEMDIIQDVEREKLVVEAIQKGVTEIIAMLPSISTIGSINEVQNSRADMTRKSPFELPDFSKKFNILEVQNYSSESQRWLGHVTSIDNSTFTARLKDLTNGGTDEMVEFELSEVPLEDRELLTIGAAFYWNVGKSIYNGQSKRESFIRFQRLKTWNLSDFESAADRASYLFDNLIMD